MQGTWKTTGGSGKAVAGVAGGIIAIALLSTGALTAAVTAITDLLTIVLVSFLGAVVILSAAAVLLWRKYGHHQPPVPGQITAFHEARQVPAAKRPAVAGPQLHLHFHGTAQPEGVPAVLQAITESRQQGEQS
jgi:hypothetical protein